MKSTLSKLLLRLWTCGPVLMPMLIAFLLYLPTLHGTLLWDDPLYLNHPLYRPPLDWAQALRLPFLLSPNYYRPLAVASFLLESAAGSASWLRHLGNVLLHVLNTALVSLLAARLIGKKPCATEGRLPLVAAGLFYAVHPALVEGVAFLSSRFDLLVTTFLLLALFCDHVLSSRRWLRVLFVGLCVLLAALSKEMATGFLLVLPLWHLAAGDSPPSLRRLLRQEWPAYLGGLLAYLVYLGIRYAALGYLYLPGSGHALSVGSPLQHLMLVARSLVEYAVLAVWPFTTLSPIHYSALPIPLASPIAWLALIFGLALLAGLGWWLRREPRSGALAAAFLLALVPVLNILPLELGGGAFAAERYLLFPLALLALALSSLLERHRPAAGLLLASLWTVAALATAVWTVPYWRSDQTLWEWGWHRAPESPTPYTNLALVTIHQGNPAAGLTLAEQALQRDPEDDAAHNHRGLALFHLGRYEEAEAAFARAAELAPENALYWNNQAGALREQGRLAEAERLLLDQALPRDPSLWVVHQNLGLVYLRADRPDLAMKALESALALAPPEEQGPIRVSLEQTADPARWLRLSDLLLANGEAEGALQALQQAEDLGAGQVDVAVGRSAALIALGEVDQAEALARAALLSAPQDARLYYHLGLIAQARGDTAAAREFFGRAAELAPEWQLPLQALAGLEE